MTSFYLGYSLLKLIKLFLENFLILNELKLLKLTKTNKSENYFQKNIVKFTKHVGNSNETMYQEIV